MFRRVGRPGGQEEAGAGRAGPWSSEARQPQPQAPRLGLAEVLLGAALRTQQWTPTGLPRAERGPPAPDGGEGARWGEQA